MGVPLYIYYANSPFVKKDRSQWVNITCTSHARHMTCRGSGRPGEGDKDGVPSGGGVRDESSHRTHLATHQGIARLLQDHLQWQAQQDDWWGQSVSVVSVVSAVSVVLVVSAVSVVLVSSVSTSVSEINAVGCDFNGVAFTGFNWWLKSNFSGLLVLLCQLY